MVCLFGDRYDIFLFIMRYIWRYFKYILIIGFGGILLLLRAFYLGKNHEQEQRKQSELDTYGIKANIENEIRKKSIHDVKRSLSKWVRRDTQ